MEERLILIFLSFSPHAPYAFPAKSSRLFVTSALVFGEKRVYNVD